MGGVIGFSSKPIAILNMPKLDWSCTCARDDEYKTIRACHILKCEKHTKSALLVKIQKDHPGEYMNNRCRCVKRVSTVSIGLTEESWLNLMKSEDFEVTEWDIQMRDSYGSWRFMIKGNHMHYNKR